MSRTEAKLLALERRVRAASWWTRPRSAGPPEDLLAGRYVLATSLGADQASAAQVVMAYRSQLEIERRFRVLKDFLHLPRCGTGPSDGSEPTWRCACTPR